MSKNEELLDDRLAELLDNLRPTPARSPEKAARGRAAYLAEVHRIVQENQSVRVPAPAVSETPFQRLKGWINLMVNPPRRKERFSMLTTITTVLVTLSLLLGGAGATVYAAQDSLPTEPLYAVKTFTEDVQLKLTADPQSQLDLLLELSDRRVSEMVAMANAGEPIAPEVADRWQAELDAALLVAANLDDEILPEAIEQLKAHIQKQDRDMDQARSNIPEGVSTVMAQVRAQLKVQAGLVDQDPTAFRSQVRQRLNKNPDTPNGEMKEPPEPGEGGFGPGPNAGPITDTLPCPDCTPVQDGSGPGPGPGPQNQGEVTQPDSGYGPGPGPGPITDTVTCPNCTPAQDGSGIGPGPGPQNQGEDTQQNESYGPGPDNQGEVTQPSDNYGPGPMATEEPSPSPEPQPSGGSSSGGSGGGH